MDISGLQTLEDAIQDLHRRKVRVMLCEANPLVEGKLRKVGIVALIGQDNFHKDFSSALAGADVAVLNS
jgi:SulP family sulfate permease